VQSFRREDFLKFYRDFYYPENYSFVVVGRTTLEDAARAFDRAFKRSLSRGKPARRGGVVQTQSEPRYAYGERAIQQANVTLGTSVPAADHADSKALDFYAVMLSGGMSFPLFQEVRDKRGLCYTVSCNHDLFSDFGLFRCYVGTSPARVAEAVKCLHEVIRSSCTEEIFRRARSLALGKQKVFVVSSPMNLHFRAVDDICLYGTPRSPEDIQQEIGSLTRLQVEAAVERHLLDERRYSYVCVGPSGTAL
jgi:predicted Zn-dependent peptidase